VCEIQFISSSQTVKHIRKSPSKSLLTGWITHFHPLLLILFITPH